jgi:hypothetical protein
MGSVIVGSVVDGTGRPDTDVAICAKTINRISTKKRAGEEN